MHRDNIRLYVFYLGIVLTIIGLSFSRAMISLGQVTLGALFLLDRNLINKIKGLAHDKAFIAFTSFFLVLCLGLIYSTDLDYGLFDVRTKIPLLLFPLIFATEPKLSKSAFRFFAFLFAANVIAAMSYSFYLYLANDLIDFRDAFIFVSHIRMSLEVLVAMSILLFYSFQNDFIIPKWLRVIMIMVSIYLLWVMLSLELMTGIVIFIVSVVFSLIRLMISKRRRINTWIAFSLGLLFIGFIFIGIQKTIKDYFDVSDTNLATLDQFSAQGNKYTHDTISLQVENGGYIGLYLQWDELRETWNKKSNLDFDGIDHQKQKLKYTLIRYLNSKQLRKDAHGLEQLTSQDVLNVENGIANAEFAKKFSYKKRIYKLLWEYDLYKNRGGTYGHSLIQRIVLWETSIDVFAKYPLFGVGTGDIRNVFNKELELANSPLVKSNLRSHNQFLSIMASLGIFGLLAFLLSMFYPPTIKKIWDQPLFFYFFSFLAIGMLWEDTIESQVGVTLYAFFFAFYLYGLEKKQI